MNDAWIAERMQHIDASGIRKAFEMARVMKDPINLSIGLPDFDVAGSVKAAAIEAIRSGKNQYTLTQGIPELRNALQAAVDAEFQHADRQVIVTSGTAGGPASGHLHGCQPRRRGDHLRSLLRDVSPSSDAGRRDVRSGRYLSRLPDQARCGRGRNHSADQVRRGQLAGQPDRSCCQR